MRVHFTETQISSVGKLPFVQSEGSYELAMRATKASTIEQINNDYSVAELQELHSILHNDGLDWRFYRGLCLGVHRHRVHTALIAYALKAKLGRVYCVHIDGLVDLMRIFHCWRYHGVTMEGIDAALAAYGVNDEVPFSVFKSAVDELWVKEPKDERIIFQNNEGSPVTIYNTIVPCTYGVKDAIRASIDLSAYETMCCHITTSMLEVPRSVALLGIAEDSCYILDTTGRNDAEIMKIFSTLIFPKRYFARLIRFDGKVTLVEDRLK